MGILKRIAALCAVALCVQAVLAAQESATADSLTKQIADYEKTIQALDSQRSQITKGIDSGVSTYQATEVERRENELKEALEENLISQDDYDMGIEDVWREVEAAARTERERLEAESRPRLAEIDRQKASVVQQKEDLESELFSQEFSIRSNKVDNSEYNPATMSIAIKVRVPEFDDDEFIVLYKLRIDVDASVTDRARRAKEERSKTLVADVRYTVKPAQNGLFMVHVTAIDVLEPNAAEPLVTGTVNKDSKTFLPGRLLANAAAAAEEEDSGDGAGAAQEDAGGQGPHTVTAEKQPWESSEDWAARQPQRSRSSRRQKEARVSDAFGFGAGYMGGRDSTMLALTVNAFSSSWGVFFADWINAVAGFEWDSSDALGIGTGFFFGDTVDVGVCFNLVGRLFPYVRAGAGFYTVEFSEPDVTGAEGGMGFLAKAGLGAEWKCSGRVKVLAEYDLYFLVGMDAPAADCVRVGVCFGKPVR